MVLSFDYGSSFIKIGLLDLNGQLRAYKRLKLSTRPNYELDSWRQALRIGAQIYLELPRKTGLSAVTVSGQNPCLLAVDRAGAALTPVIHRDNKQLKKYEESRSSLFLSFILLLKDLYPEAYARAYKILSPANYISFLLTGATKLPLPKPSYKSFFWSSELLEQHKIAPDKLPDFQDFTAQTGLLSRWASQNFQLPEATPVFCLNVDFFADILGANIFTKPLIYNRTGTSESLNIFIPANKTPSKFASFQIEHPFAESCINSMLRPSFTKVLFEAYLEYHQIAFHQIDGLMAQLLASPPILGQKSNRLLSKLLVKIPQLQFKHLEELGFSFLQEGRLIIELLALCFRADLELLYSEYPELERLQLIRLSGGQGFSVHWLQFKSALSSIKIELPHVIDSELLGGLILVSKNMALFPSLETAAAKLYGSKIVDARSADLENKYAAVYQDHFRKI